MASPQPRRQRADKEHVYAVLVEHILNGELEPGTALSERSLVERFGISRTPIRQVLWRLERDDLVEIHAHRGVFVKKMGADDIRDLFELREALEPLACGLAALHRPSRELRALEVAFTALADDEAAPVSELVRQGRDLHDAVVRWSGNRMLVRIYEVMSLQTQLMRNLLHDSSGSERRSLQEHIAIVSALERRDPSLAREAMRVHLQRSRSAVLDELFGRSPPRAAAHTLRPASEAR